MLIEKIIQFKDIDNDLMIDRKIIWNNLFCKRIFCIGYSNENIHSVGLSGYPK